MMVVINFVKYVKFVCYSRFLSMMMMMKPEEEEENQASSFFEVVFEVLHL